MIFEVKALDFNYNVSLLHKEKILSNLNFSLQQGEILCICGQNGTGKSTLLQILAGILKPSSGEILSEFPLLELTSLVMQDPDLQIIGQEVLEEMLIAFSDIDEEIQNKALQLLNDFDLLDKKIALVENLSFGQKRKLALASALMDEPQVLLLDEPSSHLDYPAMQQLRKIILQNKEKNIAQCIVAHDIEMYLDIIDTVLFLKDGKQVFYGKPVDALAYLENEPNMGVKLPNYWKFNKKIMPW